MRRVGEEHRSQTGVFEVRIHLLSHREVFQALRFRAIDVLEVVQQPVHVGFAKFAKIGVHTGGFFGEPLFQLEDVIL